MPAHPSRRKLRSRRAPTAAERSGMELRAAARCRAPTTAANALAVVAGGERVVGHAARRSRARSRPARRRRCRRAAAVARRLLQPIPAHVRHPRMPRTPACAHACRAAGPRHSTSPSSERSNSNCMPRQMPSSGCVSARINSIQAELAQARHRRAGRADAGQDHALARRAMVSASARERGAAHPAAPARSAPSRCWRRRHRSSDRRAAITACPWCSAARCLRAGSPGAARARPP